MSNFKHTIILNKIFEKVDQHTRGEWLIHGTKRRKDNQLQSLELPCRISITSREWKYDTKESEGNMFKPIFNEHIQGRKHLGS